MKKMLAFAVVLAVSFLSVATPGHADEAVAPGTVAASGSSLSEATPSALADPASDSTPSALATPTSDFAATATGAAPDLGAIPVSGAAAVNVMPAPPASAGQASPAAVSPVPEAAGQAAPATANISPAPAAPGVSPFGSAATVADPLAPAAAPMSSTLPAAATPAASVSPSTATAPAPVVYPESNEVVVYNWAEFIPQDVLTDFERETGIKVVYSIFESNESMFAKVKMLNGKGYDVIFPSSYFVDLMRKAGLLHDLDHAKLPNLHDFDPNLLNQAYDPGNRYSIPYMWGSLGLAYNTKFIPKGSLAKWAQLLDPAYAGKIQLVNDLRDAFGLALKATGSSINTEKSEDIEKAYNFLVNLKKRARVFDVATTKQNLISEDVWVSPIWDGNYLVAKEENSALEYVFPDEGAVYWVDSMVISAGGANIENAYTFINFMMRSDITARCMEQYRYISPNLEGQKQIKEGTVLLPPPHLLKNAEFIGDVGESLSVYSKFWNMLKAQ